MIGAWGIARVEGVTVNAIRVRFKKGHLPAVEVAPRDRHGERRLRVPGVVMLERWGGDVEAHVERLLQLARTEEVTPDVAAIELSMKIWDLESHTDLVNADGTVDTEDLFALAGIDREAFLHAQSLTSA
ncbi:hypothetical protein FND50_12615 [Rhodococcus sp. WB9]|uniref:hypothetical protein n=1 Tax=Rhodococcus sp. WB9 TaxID=2594007 RepID=UPI0011855F1A|nr:hypothetical protein [Rhodococcus sp. WB9]QDQ91576.1 hypothetical protein FND50_12615 [Rhodococcus sp. WB9]